MGVGASIGLVGRHAGEGGVACFLGTGVSEQNCSPAKSTKLYNACKLI